MNCVLCSYCEESSSKIEQSFKFQWSTSMYFILSDTFRVKESRIKEYRGIFFLFGARFSRNKLRKLLIIWIRSDPLNSQMNSFVFRRISSESPPNHLRESIALWEAPDFFNPALQGVLLVGRCTWSESLGRAADWETPDWRSICLIFNGAPLVEHRLLGTF